MPRLYYPVDYSAAMQPRPNPFLQALQMYSEGQKQRREMQDAEESRQLRREELALRKQQMEQQGKLYDLDYQTKQLGLQQAQQSFAEAREEQAAMKDFYSRVGTRQKESPGMPFNVAYTFELGQLPPKLQQKALGEMGTSLDNLAKGKRWGQFAELWNALNPNDPVDDKTAKARFGDRKMVTLPMGGAVQEFIGDEPGRLFRGPARPIGGGGSAPYDTRRQDRLEDYLLKAADSKIAQAIRSYERAVADPATPPDRLGIMQAEIAAAEQERDALLARMYSGGVPKPAAPGANPQSAWFDQWAGTPTAPVTAALSSFPGVGLMQTLYSDLSQPRVAQPETMPTTPAVGAAPMPAPLQVDDVEATILRVRGLTGIPPEYMPRMRELTQQFLSIPDPDRDGVPRYSLEEAAQMAADTARQEWVADQARGQKRSLERFTTESLNRPTDLYGGR